MKQIKELKPAELEKIAQEYLLREMQIEKLEELNAPLKQQLINLVGRYGNPAPRAEKTRRIETDGYQVDATFGQSVSVNDEEVERFKKKCDDRGEGRIFHLLFEARKKYVKVPGAEEKSLQAPITLRRLFQRCFEIKATAPKLSVKSKEEKAQK